MGLVSRVRRLDLPAVIEVGREGADTYVVTQDSRSDDGGPRRRRPAACDLRDLLMSGAAAALGDPARRAGLVHGAVAPATLMSTGEDTTIVTGAGLGRGLPPPDLRPGRSLQEDARCLDPEEAAGGPAGPASDVYRLGLIYYLLLTGRHAFDGPDAASSPRQLDGVRSASVPRPGRSRRPPRRRCCGP